MTEIDDATVERAANAIDEILNEGHGPELLQEAARAVLAASGWAERLEHAESRAGLAMVDMTRAEQRVAALEAALRDCLAIIHGIPVADVSDKMAVIRQRLLAALSAPPAPAPERDGWRPIGEAKYGVPILVWRPSNQEIVTVQRYNYPFADNCVVHPPTGKIWHVDHYLPMIPSPPRETPS
jgi:hypothetical protein